MVNWITRLALLFVLIAPAQSTAQITEIIDSTGDGLNPFSTSGALIGFPDIAVDLSGNVYVTGDDSHNAFKITPAGTITEIIDTTGEGGGDVLLGPGGIDVDPSGNVFIAATASSNAYKITPGGTISEIINSTGDGSTGLGLPLDVVFDLGGNAYVSGGLVGGLFKITPGGVITEVSGILGCCFGWMAVDASNRLLAINIVIAIVFRVDPLFPPLPPPFPLDVVIDGAGDGFNGLADPRGIAIDAAGNVYVAGFGSHNAFRITPAGTITQILDSSGDGGGNVLDTAFGVAVAPNGVVYVAGSETDNVFRITPGGVITEIIDSTGDGAGNLLDYPTGVAVDTSGNVYVVGADSQNVFKIEINPFCGDGLVEGSETCDDSNTASGDGCSATCQVEPSWSCGDEPSVCILVPALQGGGVIVLCLAMLSAAVLALRFRPETTR